MINFNKTIKNELYLVLFITVFVQLLLGIQGFDVCDDGFALTFYQQIYNNPSSVEYNFVYWLSGIVGGVWYELYPQGGVIWFKIFTIIVNSLIFVVGYNIFKQFVPQRIAFLGLLISLFVNDYGFLVYYHNHLTVLLTVSSVLFLLKGLIKNRAWFIIISGTIIGMNVFARIPNLTLFVFILGIPFYYFFKRKALKYAIKPMLQYVLGILIGFVIIVLLLLALGQFSIMQNAILSLYDLGAAKDSTHNIGGLLTTYISKYIVLYGAFGQLLLIIILFFVIYNTLKNGLWLKKLLLFILFCYTFLWFKTGDIYTIYALAYFGVFFILFTKQNSGTKTLAFLGVLMLTFLPLGSGGAITSSGYMCIWLAVPFFFYFFNSLKTTSINFRQGAEKRNIVLSEKSFRIFILFISISFFSAKAYNLSKQAYFDKGSRFEKTFTIKNNLAKGIYTTELRAKIINELLINLKGYVKPNDYLLAYDKIPMVHFLTETKPYMYNSWVWIYDSHSFENKLKQAEKEIKIYPVVVTQKFETTLSFSNPIPNYLSKNLVNTHGLINYYDAKKNASLNKFLSKNNYEIVWSNDYFNVFKTKKIHE